MKPLGILLILIIFIGSEGIDFSKERKLGWVDKTGVGNSESRDIESKGQEQERTCPLAPDLA